MLQNAEDIDEVTVTSTLVACEMGQWERALELLNQMPHWKLQRDLIAFNAACSATAGARRLEVVQELIEILKDEGLTPDVVTFNALLNACERARQWQEALETLRRMRSCQLVPDIVSFGSAMAGCELCARWDLALALLSEASEMSLQLSLVACSTAVSACAQGRRWRWAMRLFEAARPLGLDVTIFCAALSGCGRAGCWEMSLQLLDEMCGLRMEPDKVTCAAAVAACELSAEPRHALRLLAGTEQRAAEWVRSFQKVDF
ncbi:unnamed protein product, partial [Cladocopium goreaui]